MTIAIIDSGVEETLALKLKLTGISFENVNGEIIKTEDIKDFNGHGTKVFKIVNEFNQGNVKYFIVKILNESNVTSSKVLLEALVHLLSVDVKCILMCLSTNNSELQNELQQTINQLSKQGKIIIASQTNFSDKKSYPASLYNTIGVKGDIQITNEVYCSKSEDIQIFSNTKNVYMFYEGCLTSFGGNSKATAMFSGMFLQYIEKTLNVDEFVDLIQLQNKYKDFIDFASANVMILNKFAENSSHNIAEDSRLFQLKVLLISFVKHELLDVSKKDDIFNIRLGSLFSSLADSSHFFVKACDLYEVDFNTIVFEHESIQTLHTLHDFLSIR